jgi:hypothetical protein
MPNVVSHKEFIGIYDDALSKEECDYIINQFDLIEANDKPKVEAGDYWHTNEMQRNDFWIYSSQHLPEVHQLAGERLHECLSFYCQNYFTVKGINASSLEVKVQRTPPRGGYHVWHCEQDCLKHGARVLAWTIYLNDIPYNEGETEFLWQGVRVNPKAGRCAIWPASFTHTHRGNPVYTHDKYIATGWYTLI